MEAGLLVATIAIIYPVVASGGLDEASRWIADQFLPEPPALEALGPPRPHGPVIDGFPVGGSAECDAARCSMFIELATPGLDERDPNHAAVVTATVHAEEIGHPMVPESDRGSARSGIYVIVVFQLADGTRSAIGVGCSAVHCQSAIRYVD